VENISLEQIKSAVERWKVLSNQKGGISTEDALLLFKKHFQYFPSVMIPDATHGLNVYRTRVILKDSKEDITNPKTFSYAPNASSYQRANTPGYPVFYAAIDGKTALQELRVNGIEPVKRGDQIYLSEWRVKPGEKCNLNCLTTPDLIGDEYFVGPIAQQLNIAIPLILSKLQPELREIQIYVMAELASIFLKGSYFQSGIIAHHLIYESRDRKTGHADGVIYPSCANNFESLNYALHPHFVDNNMEIVSVRKISFDEFTNEGFQLTNTYFAKQVGDKIQWSKYVSNLRMNFKVSIKVVDDWTLERVNSATFYQGEEEWIFDKFCEYLIDSADFTGHSMKPENEQAYIDGTGAVFDMTFDFDAGECVFRDGNGETCLTGLWLRIPVDTSIQIASAEEVMAN
jgi:hypothetical protein